MNPEATLRANPAAFLADQVKFGASNLDTVCIAKGEKLLLPDQYRTLATAYLNGINSALRRGFPDDAFRFNLRALTIVADDIPSREVDLDAERVSIMQRIGLPPGTTRVTTKLAYGHFLPYTHSGCPTMEPELYESITSQMSAYIAECVRRGITERNPDQLERVIPMMRLLAYAHKAVKLIYYGCEGEFDVMTRWGVNRETLEFVTLTREQSLAKGETTSENMHSRR